MWRGRDSKESLFYFLDLEKQQKLVETKYPPFLMQLLILIDDTSIGLAQQSTVYIMQKSRGYRLRTFNTNYTE